LVTETFQRGVFFQHLQQSHGLHGLDDTLGSGACVFDMDNDNDLDLYFVSGSGATRFFGKQHWWSEQPQGQLYRNDGDGFFNLVTHETGLPKDQWGMGCNSADIDKDGFDDLIITSRGKNWIAFGDGQGFFTSMQLGKTENWSTAVSLHDINNDGLLDIYIGNYIKFQKNSKTLEVNTGFNINDGAFLPENFPAQKNELYINKGTRLFIDETKKFNLANSDGRTLGIQWLNENNDEWQDLLIINDNGSEPQLLISQKGETFTRAPLRLQIDSLNGLRSTTTLTLNDDTSQPINIYSSNLGNPLYLLSKKTNGYENLTWDILSGADKLESLSQWGLASSDFNGDGLNDLYVGSGLTKPDNDAHRLSQGQPDSLLLQMKNGKFHKKNKNLDIGLSTRSVISADIDNDGDIDLILTHNNGPAQVKINYSNPEHWVGLDIRDKFGLKNNFREIKIQQGKKSIWLYPISDSFLGNQDYRKLTTLNDNKDLNVTIYWNNGSTSKFHELQTGVFHTLKQHGNSSSISKKTHKAITPIPFDLAIWQIKSGKIDWKRIVKSFSGLDIKKQNILLNEAHKQDNHSLILAFIETALNQNTYLNSSIEILRDQELEISLPLVFNYINDNLTCKTANIFENWFKEEESMLLSKNLFTRPLVMALKYAKPSLQICILHALSESRQLRPVYEIEHLLNNSKHIKVKRAALYSLGKLRRSQSIAIIKSYLDDPLLKNEAKQALNNFSSKNSMQYKLTTEQKIIPDHHSEKTMDPGMICPRVSIDKALDMNDREIATIFNLCSSVSLKKWLLKNESKVIQNISKLIKNSYLSAPQLNLLLNKVNGKKINGIETLLAGLLKRVNDSSKKKEILQAMYFYRYHNIVQSSSMDILINKNNSKSLRIAAGNILIERKPDLVMMHSGSIFNEK